MEEDLLLINNGLLKANQAELPRGVVVLGRLSGAFFVRFCFLLYFYCVLKFAYSLDF